MHRSRQDLDITIVSDDDDDQQHHLAQHDDIDDDDLSSHRVTPSKTNDYSSLMVESPSESSAHRHSYSIRSSSPSPSAGVNGSQLSNLRPSHRRFSQSTTQLDSNTQVHRERLRFNTWPRHRKDKCDILADYEKRLAKSVIQELGIGINKTYRNPWGNLSYAQLITRAIDSSPWKRLTLNEVYEWIVKFVPYFKDKTDPKSSWGWKVSCNRSKCHHSLSFFFLSFFLCFIEFNSTQSFIA